MTWTLRLRRSRRDRLAALLVLGGLAAFVVLVYLVVVLGGGILIGHTESPHLGLSVVATAFIALAFEPVQSRLERRASRLAHAGRSSPYDVLSRFSTAVTGSYAAEELPGRMAKLLADGTGAEWAQVWLVIDGRLRLASTWPRGAAPESVDPDGAGAPGRRSLPVRQAGELLGVLVVQEREQVPLTPVEERLYAGLANQAGLVLRGARLRAELVHRLADLSTRAEDLRLSRQRLVDAQDAERRRLERDIHDGAQQHLVALSVNLRLAQTLAQRAPGRAAQVLAEQDTAASETIETLVSLSRGIYPRLLGAHGVGTALRAAVGAGPIPVEVVEHDVGRYPAGVEAAAYFCCLEALQNAAKHSGADRVRVELSGEDGGLAVVVEDDGSGFDPRSSNGGVGMANMRDRIESVGGQLTVDTRPGRGSRVEARLPSVCIPAQREG